MLWLPQVAANTIWIDDIDGTKFKLPVDKIICICQHPQQPRSRIFYFFNTADSITIPMRWKKCFDLLTSSGINFFVTKSRSHLVVKNYIEKYEKPYVRLQNFPAKVEVIKENLKDFELWLLKEK